MRADDFAAYGADFIVPPKPRQRGAKRAMMQQHIVVQKEQGSGGGKTQALIGGPQKPGILGQPEDFGAEDVVADVPRVVGRRIVDQNQLDAACEIVAQ